MGDRSPKSIEHKKKQAEAAKTQKQADAHSKAHPAPRELGNKKK